MEKAKQAKTASENADELDSIKLAVVDAVAHGNDGYVGAKALREALGDFVTDGSSITDGSTGPWTVTGAQTGIQYKIYANGNVEALSGVSISPTTIAFTEGGTPTATITATLSEDLIGKAVTWEAFKSDGTTVSSALTVIGSATSGTTATATVTLATADEDLAQNGGIIKASVSGVSEKPTCAVSYTENTITTINVKTTSVTVTQGKTDTIEVEGLGALGSVIPLTGNEGITYTSNATAKATVSTDGSTYGEAATSTSTNPSSVTVKGVVAGSTSITVTCSGKTVTYNGESSGSVGVTVEEYYITNDYSWTELSVIAKLISDNSGTILYTDSSAEVEYNNKTVTLNVGDKAKLKYNGTEKVVRIIGFNHDDLESSDAYVENGTNTKAGITFEFVDIIGTRVMHSGMGASNWKESEMRSALNNASDNGTYLAKMYDLTEKDEQKGTHPIKLSDNIIKSVKKPYLASYNATSATIPTQGDKLWLFSEAEIWGTNKTGNAVEGSRYKQYALGRSWVRYNGSTAASWWLRTPASFNMVYRFCYVSGNVGAAQEGKSSVSLGISPGFAI